MKKLFGSPLREREITTFRQELNHQCNQIMVFVSLISFAWLPYIPKDQALHPGQPLIVALRIGLPLLGVLIFLLRLHPRFKNRGLAALIIFGGYLEIATGIITGLSGGHSVYIGGYLFILTLLAIVPIPRKAAWSILGLSLLSFALFGYLQGMTFSSPEEFYSLNDLISTALVAAVFIFLVDGIRHRSWEKSKVIQDQNRRLAQDKEKIDHLLLNILPAPVARELKETGSVKPVMYPEATVVFTDFVGFTRIAETLEPETLVAELDQAFSRFDEIMGIYGLEKLKTIGDSYMFAGGIPHPSPNHRIDCILASLDILRWIQEKNGSIHWEIRIGINTGPLMAGVVGDKKFVYDIWGDSVNVASRLETGGIPGHVNITESTKKGLEKLFEIIPRGKIVTKNRGELEMYLLPRLKREYSADEEGFIPNAAFWKEYTRRKKAETT